MLFKHRLTLITLQGFIISVLCQCPFSQGGGGGGGGNGWGGSHHGHQHHGGGSHQQQQFGSGLGGFGGWGPQNVPSPGWNNPGSSFGVNNFVQPNNNVYPQQYAGFPQFFNNPYLTVPAWSAPTPTPTSKEVKTSTSTTTTTARPSRKSPITKTTSSIAPTTTTTLAPPTIIHIHNNYPQVFVDEAGPVKQPGDAANNLKGGDGDIEEFNLSEVLGSGKK